MELRLPNANQRLPILILVEIDNLGVSPFLAEQYDVIP